MKLHKRGSFQRGACADAALGARCTFTSGRREIRFHSASHARPMNPVKRNAARQPHCSAMGVMMSGVVEGHLTLAVRELVTQEPGPQMGTVGHLEVEPNASNVIAGRVRLSIDLRYLSTEKLRRLGEAIRARALAIGGQTKTQIALTQTQHAEPALASPEVQAVIQRAAEHLKLSNKSLPSGAVHDAQGMATLGPVGMIFVPSVGGHQPFAQGVDQLGGLWACSGYWR
jgi:acetylornithine deacetylase/succinyl-diaminopimelate desuccinylase-like protein